MTSLKSFPAPYRAVVFGASGGIGAAVMALLQADPACADVMEFSRSSHPRLDLEDEASIKNAAEAAAPNGPVHLMFDATGLLWDDLVQPEKSIAAVDPALLSRSFAVNAVGPLLLLKHFSPLMPRPERSVFATLSARVGSIGDNRLGGWYGYRASKAALNMFVRTAAIELARKRPQSVCLALHPGTVATRLSDPFAGARSRLSANQAAQRLLRVVDGAGPDDSGAFLAYDGSRIDW